MAATKKRKKAAYSMAALIRLAKSQGACDGGIAWLRRYKEANPTHSAADFFRHAMDDTLHKRPSDYTKLQWKWQRERYLVWAAENLVEWPAMNKFDDDGLTLTWVNRFNRDNIALYNRIFNVRESWLAFCVSNEKLTAFLVKVFS